MLRTPAGWSRRRGPQRRRGAGEPRARLRVAARDREPGQRLERSREIGPVPPGELPGERGAVRAIGGGEIVLRPREETRQVTQPRPRARRRARKRSTDVVELGAARRRASPTRGRSARGTRRTSRPGRARPGPSNRSSTYSRGKGSNGGSVGARDRELVLEPAVDVGPRGGVLEAAPGPHQLRRRVDADPRPRPRTRTPTTRGA